MKFSRILGLIIILLIIFEIILSSYLIYKNFNKVNEGICMPGGNCESVQDSEYGKLFGIKLPFYSIIAFTILLIIYFINKKGFIYGTGLGGLFALYLIFIQLFILKQICINCMILDSVMLIIFGLSLLDKLKN